MDRYQYNEQSHELFIKRENEYTPYPGGVGKYYFDRLNQLVTENENSIAQIEAETGKTQTFRQLLQSSIKLAQYMRSNGIQPGDNITMCSYNHINSEVVVIATYFVGAVMSATDPILSEEDTKYLLNMIKPRIIFVSDGSEKLIETCIEEIQYETKVVSVSLNSHDKYETIEEILAKTKIAEDFKPIFVSDLNTTSSILFSSGTTGLPKGICLTHNYFLASLSLFPVAFWNFVLLSYATFYWTSCMDSLGMSLQMGSARLLVRKFEPTEHWLLCEKYKVNLLIISNANFIEAEKYIPKNDKLEDLKAVVIGGGLVPEKDITNYIEKLPKIEIGYGYALTENGLVAKYTSGDKFNSNGKPYPINQTIKIVDPDTEINLPLNKIGEVRIKHPFQMKGYYKVDSTDAWDVQGFLKTGDLGYFDDDYNLFIVDRIKEMFKYRGWHVVPAKIENVLSTHPDVLYAIVIGKPSYNEDENHAMAVVCLHEGSSVSAEELEAFVNQKMDDMNQIRAGVKLIKRSEIEFTPSGKINRRFLKSKFITK